MKGSPPRTEILMGSQSKSPSVRARDCLKKAVSAARLAEIDETLRLGGIATN